MEKIKKYCVKNGYEFGKRTGGGIIIYVPYNESTKVIKYIKRIAGVTYDQMNAWVNYPCGFKMLPVVELT